MAATLFWSACPRTAFIRQDVLRHDFVNEQLADILDAGPDLWFLGFKEVVDLAIVALVIQHQAGASKIRWTNVDAGIVPDQPVDPAVGDVVCAREERRDAGVTVTNGVEISFRSSYVFTGGKFNCSLRSFRMKIDLCCIGAS